MVTLLDDLRFAWRSLVSTRVTTIAAVVTLALGTGANTAVLAVAYGVLLRPLPFADPGKLVVIDTQSTRTGGRFGIKLADVAEWQRGMTATVAGVTAFAPADFTLRGAGEPDTVHALLVSGPLFDVLGVSPQRGAAFRDSRATTIVVSDSYAGRFGGLDAAVGRPVTIGAAGLQVGGVMPSAFAFPDGGVDAWVPADSVGTLVVFGQSDSRSYRLIARLKPGVSIAAAREDAARVLRELHPETPLVRTTVVPLLDLVAGDARPVLAAFVVAAALLLLVACANAAVLLVGRAAARRRELAVRLALGASPARLIRTSFAESGLLALAGSALGIVVADVSLRLLVRAGSASLPRVRAIAVDWPVLAAAAAVAVAVTILSGLAPARGAARTDFAPAFRTTSASTSANRTRGPLVVLQVAVAVLLLTGAGLLGRTVMTLLRGHGGVDPSRVVAARLALTEGTTFDARGRAPFVAALLERARALPGVVAAGIGSNLPPRHNQLSMTIRMLNESTGRDDTHTADLVSVSAGYLEALGVRLIRGRLFDAHDADAASPVAILSEGAARDFAFGKDPLDHPFVAALPTLGGKRVRPMVVGIVSNVHYDGLDAAANDDIYVLWQNLPTGFTYLVARTAGSPAALLSDVRNAVRTADPGLPLPELRTLDDEMDLAIAGRELRLDLVAAFAGLAFVVAVLGLAAALARSVVERREELAIRSALGATPDGVVRLIASGGLRLVAIGIALGLVATAATGRWLASLLSGVSPYDAATYLVVAVSVLVTSAIACYLPARRAARVDPLELLRGE